MILEAFASYAFNRQFLCQSLATLGTFFTIQVFASVLRRKRRYELFKYYGIPTPEFSIFSGNFYLYRGEDAIFNIDKRLSKRFGSVFGMLLGDEPKMIITDLNKLKQIFFEETSSFTERTFLFLETPLSDGILFCKFPRWRAMRKIMAPPFNAYTMRGSSSTEFIENSLRMMIEYIEAKLKESSEKEKPKVVIDLQSLMQSTALHLISAMAIKLPNVQVKENEDNVKCLDAFLESSDRGIVEYAIMFPFIKSILQVLADNFEFNSVLAQVQKSLNKVIDDGLRKLKNNPDAKSDNQMIDQFIKLHHEGKMSRKEVIGNAQALLFAGYETTSTTLTYVFWILAKHPEIQDKLRDELKAHGVESQYLSQVINETMRLYPTVISFTTRIATKTVKIDDLVIPQGCQVTYNNWLVNRDPKVWPEPEKFDPDNFRPGVEIHPCAFAPFGLGERRCLGYQLALLEMKMVVCDVLLRFRLNLIAPLELELATRAHSLSRPKGEVKLEIERI